MSFRKKSNRDVLAWPTAMGMCMVFISACQPSSGDGEEIGPRSGSTALTVGQAAPEQRPRAAPASDSFIATQVKTALFKDPQASGFQIVVNTYRGVVQLSGFVDTDAQKQRAGELARRIAGVRAVHNDLILRSQTHFTDATGQASPDFTVVESRKEGGS